MASTIHSAFLPSKQAAEEVGSHAVKVYEERKGNGWKASQVYLQRTANDQHELWARRTARFRLSTREAAYQLVSGEDLWGGSETVQRRTSEKGRKNSLAQVLGYKAAFHSGKFHFLSDKLSFPKEKVTLFLKTCLMPSSYTVGWSDLKTCDRAPDNACII